MLPLVVRVHVLGRAGHGIRLWIPLFLMWLLLLPFRIVGIAVHGVLELVWAAVMLPARLITAPFRLRV